MATVRPSAAEIFDEAMRRPPGNDRANYLHTACGGDAELKDRVQRLLVAFAEAGSFLEVPAADVAATADGPTIAERPGVRIGPYKLLQQIGEGGFGVVFLAEQERPVRRKVALKVIKPGMDTRQVIARFEAERQALAMMDHPNIAKVYDAGTTGDPVSSSIEHPASSIQHIGRPYFVMELVQGVPITEYCDRCNLTTRERLELFITVCHAMQHAHQKGVIHRDIKPTNVLVAIQDGRPTPKIIDFGVAKAINQQLTEHTLMTAFAQIIGTPLYMSPEQAELSPLGVDTRSDIYSLGVLLYELLTGTTPFDKDRLQAASYDELRRIIREEEPPRPSARISTLAADQAMTVADHRRTDSRRLRQTVRGDLDWIVMNCLEKDRCRRYDSAGSLARDIERYLQDEPVLACPPSLSYSLKKLIRRNRAAAAFICLLLLGIAALTVSNIRSRRNEHRAITETAKAKAVGDLLQQMLSSADTYQSKGRGYTVRELLDDSSAALGNQLADLPDVEVEIRATIGRAYRSLGMAELAKSQLERAMELGRKVYGSQHENVAAILVEYAWTLEHERSYNEAEPYVQEALDIYRKRGVTGSQFFHALRVLQDLLISARRHDEAEKITREAMSIVKRTGVESTDFASMLHQYAEMQNRLGHSAEAEEIAREAIAMHRRLHGDNRETAHALSKLANALESQNKLEPAEETLFEMLAILRRYYTDDHVNIRNVTERLKTIAQARGDQAALETLVKEETELKRHSDSAGYQLHLAELLLSNNPTEAQKEEAHELVRRASEEYAQVAIDFPDDLNRRLTAVEGYTKVAALCAAHADFAEEVERAYGHLTVDAAGLLARFRDSASGQEEVGHKYRLWAFAVQQNSNYLPQVEQAHREAIKLFEKVSRDQPNIWFFVANTYTYLGETLWRSAKLDDAGETFRQAMKIYNEHATEIAENTNPDNIAEVVWDYSRLAYFLASTDNEDEAAEFVQKAVLNTQRLTEPSLLANAFYYVALVQLRLGDSAGYRATCKALVDLPIGGADYITRSRPIWTPCLAPDGLDNLNLHVKRTQEFIQNNESGPTHFGLYLLGAAHYRAGQYEQAVQRLQESIDVYPSATQNGFDTMNYQQLLLATTKWQTGHHDEARRLLAVTLPVVDKELQSPSAFWNRRATLELLRGEAEALIQENEAKETVDNVEPNQSAPTTNSQ